MSFTSDILRFRKRTRSEMDRVYRGVAIKLFSAVIKDTPVDTGRLRGNWQCTLGSPATSELDTNDKSGSAAIGGVIGTLGGATMKDTVVLTNNLPYAYRIEYDGWSKSKAPEGMVRRNVDRFRRLIAEQIKKKGGI